MKFQDIEEGQIFFEEFTGEFYIKIDETTSVVWDYTNYPDTPYYDKHWNSFVQNVNGRIQFIEELRTKLTHTTQIPGHRKSVDDLLYELRHTENSVTRSVLVDCIVDRLKRREYT